MTLCNCGRKHLPILRYGENGPVHGQYCRLCQDERQQENADRRLPPGVQDVEVKLKALDIVIVLLARIGYTPGPLLEIKHDLRRLHQLEGGR